MILICTGDVPHQVRNAGHLASNLWMSLKKS